MTRICVEKCVASMSISSKLKPLLCWCMMVALRVPSLKPSNLLNRSSRVLPAKTGLFSSLLLPPSFTMALPCVPWQAAQEAAKVRTWVACSGLKAKTPSAWPIMGHSDGVMRLTSSKQKDDAFFIGSLAYRIGLI